MVSVGNTHIQSRIVSRLSICAVLVLILSVAACQSSDAASNASGPLLYVCNHESRNISIIDTGDGRLIDSIEGLSSPYGTAVSPDGSRLYAVGSQSGTVSAIDLRSWRITGNVDVGTGADRMVISPDGSRLYVKHMDDIRVIDTAAMKIIADIHVSGKTLKGMTISPDGSKLYLADLKGSTVLVIDTSTNSVVHSIMLDSLPMSTVVSPDGTRVYAACVNTAAKDEFGSACACLAPMALPQLFADWLSGSGSKDINAIYVIDAANYSIIKTIDTDGIPFGIALSPNGSTLYAACGDHYGSYIEVINASTGIITEKVPAKLGLWMTGSLDGVPTAADNSSLFILQPGGGSMYGGALYQFDTSDLTSFKNIGVAADAVSMSMAPDGKTMYVAGRRGNTISMVDIRNGTVDDALKLWWDPQFIAFGKDGSRAYVTSENSGTVTVINTSDNGIASIIDVGKSPKAVAVSPGGEKVYVAHSQENYQADGTISVIDTRTNAPVNTLTVGVNPSGMAFSPDGNLLYVVNHNPTLMAVNLYGTSVQNIEERRSDSLYVFNVTTDEVVTTINVKYMPAGIAVSPDGSRIYVTCVNGSTVNQGNVWVLDSTSYALLGVFDVGAEPKGIVVSPDGDRLYVVSPKDYSIYVIDAASGNLTSKIDLGTYMTPYCITMSPNGDRIYVTIGDWPSGSVAVIDTASNKVIDKIKVGSWPTGLAIREMS